MSSLYSPEVMVCKPALEMMMDFVKTPSHAARVRGKLNDLVNELPNDKKPVAQLAIYLLKKKFNLPKMPTRSHMLTDHAFCRVLERGYGINMDRLKDIAYRDFADKKEFNFLGNEEMVFTVIKKVK